MRSPGDIVVDKSQRRIDCLRDSCRGIVPICSSCCPNTSIVQRIGPWILSIGERRLLPWQRGRLKNDVDAMVRRLQRLPFRSAAAPELPIPGNVIQLDPTGSDAVMFKLERDEFGHRDSVRETNHLRIDCSEDATASGSNLTFGILGKAGELRLDGYLVALHFLDGIDGRRFDRQSLTGGPLWGGNCVGKIPSDIDGISV